MKVTFDNQPKLFTGWIPLEKFSQKYPNQINCNDFIHMGKIGDIELYESIVSRYYINIDSDGNCWAYGSDDKMKRALGSKLPDTMRYIYYRIHDETAIKMTKKRKGN